MSVSGIGMKRKRLVRFFVKLFCGKWNGSGTERLSGGFDEDFSLTVCVACGVWRGKRKGKWKGNGLTADFVEWTRFVGIAGVEIGNGFGSVL